MLEKHPLDHVRFVRAGENDSDEDEGRKSDIDEEDSEDEHDDKEDSEEDKEDTDDSDSENDLSCGEGGGQLSEKEDDSSGQSRSKTKSKKRKQTTKKSTVSKKKKTAAPKKSKSTSDDKKKCGPFRKFDAYINECHPGWTPIPGYGANKHGYIRKSNGSIVLGGLEKDGYRRVAVRCKHKTKPNKDFKQMVSQLVASACKLKQTSTRHTSLDHINSKDTGNNAVRLSV
jgi:hypothetical protein